MSLKANHFAQHASTLGGFPNTGGVGGKKKAPAKKKVRAKKGLSSEQKAEQAQADEAYYSGQTPKSRNGRVRRRRVKIRRPRVGKGQSSSTAGSAKRAGKAQGQSPTNAGNSPQEAANRQILKSRMNAQSSLNQMSSGFRNSQAGRPRGPQTALGKKVAMLRPLREYMQNDYNHGKANPEDKAFLYPTSAKRQLVATLGTMISGATKQSQKKEEKKDTDSTNDKGLSPEAFARTKSLFRKLMAMSDPGGQLPEGLPADYKPYERVA